MWSCLCMYIYPVFSCVCVCVCVCVCEREWSERPPGLGQRGGFLSTPLQLPILSCRHQGPGPECEQPRVPATGAEGSSDQGRAVFLTGPALTPQTYTNTLHPILYTSHTNLIFTLGQQGNSTITHKLHSILT